MAKQQMSVVQKQKTFKELNSSGILDNKVAVPDKDDFTNYYLFEGRIRPNESIAASSWKKFTRSELRKYFADNHKDVVSAVSSRGYTVQGLKQIAKKLNFTLLIEPDEMNYNRAVSAYNEETIRIKSLVSECLKEEFGVRGNSKADECFEIAYTYGKDDGYPAVYTHFAKLVGLINTQVAA